MPAAVTATEEAMRTTAGALRDRESASREESEQQRVRNNPVL